MGGFRVFGRVRMWRAKPHRPHLRVPVSKGECNECDKPLPEDHVNLDVSSMLYKRALSLNSKSLETKGEYELYRTYLFNHNFGRQK